MALRLRGAWIKGSGALLVLSTSSPLAMMFATQGSPDIRGYLVRLFSWMVALTAVSFGVSAVVRLIWGAKLTRLPGALPFVVLSALTSVTLLVDAFMGGRLVRFTIINASNFSGFRFYGVGNEYMGVWLGMAIVAVVWLRECWPGWEKRGVARLALLAACAAVVVALGLPRFGANAGGAVSAVVGLGLVYVSGVKRRFTVRDVVMLTAAGFAAVAAISVFDMAVSHGAPSHIGLAAYMSKRQGYSYLLDMVVRKVTMNFELLATGQSQVALIGSVPFALMWFCCVRRRVDAMVADRPQLRWGIMASIVTAATAFMYNDSGVVAGGLIFGFLVVAMLYSVLSDGYKPLTKQS
jgi:hypothetical protein